VKLPDNSKTKPPVNIEQRLTDYLVREVGGTASKPIPILPLKIQILLFYAYVWGVVLSDRQLFPEKIQARKTGPCLMSEYKRLKKYEDKKNFYEFHSPFAVELPYSITKYAKLSLKCYGSLELKTLTEMVLTEDPVRDALLLENQEEVIITDESIWDYYASRECYKSLPKGFKASDIKNYV
jgi:uncharacterized phage-associated protein